MGSCQTPGNDPRHREQLYHSQQYYNFEYFSYDITKSKTSHVSSCVGDSDVAPYSLDRWVGAWKAYVSRRWPKEEINRFGNGAFGIAKCGAIKPAM
jgi:hypothetical protein